MGVCLDKKCFFCNEKKKDIISINVKKKDKYNIENELKGQEKSIITNENLINNNSKQKINNISSNIIDISNFVIKSNYNYLNYPCNGHLSNNSENINDKFNNYVQYKEKFEKLIYFTRLNHTKINKPNFTVTTTQ